jgi:hypothetical protein
LRLPLPPKAAKAAVAAVYQRRNGGAIWIMAGKEFVEVGNRPVKVLARLQNGEQEVRRRW